MRGSEKSYWMSACRARAKWPCSTGGPGGSRPIVAEAPSSVQPRSAVSSSNGSAKFTLRSARVARYARRTCSGQPRPTRQRLTLRLLARRIERGLAARGDIGDRLGITYIYRARLNRIDQHAVGSLGKSLDQGRPDMILERPANRPIGQQVEPAVRPRAAPHAHGQPTARHAFGRDTDATGLGVGAGGLEGDGRGLDGD